MFDRNVKILSKILTERELARLEDVVPSDFDGGELKKMITCARRWRHQSGKASHTDD